MRIFTLIGDDITNLTSKMENKINDLQGKGWIIISISHSYNSNARMWTGLILAQTKLSKVLKGE